MARVIGLLVFSFALFMAASCAKPKEKLHYGSVSGHVIDGRTGSKIAGTSLLALDETDAFGTSDSNGYYIIPTIEANTHLIYASAAGFDSQSQGVTISKNEEFFDFDFIMFPTGFAANKVVVVLTWGASPTDLDSHLYVPDGSPFAEIDYGNRGNDNFAAAPYSSLDLDDTTSYGPETTRTLLHPETKAPIYAGTYRFFVHNYSQQVPLTVSQAIVRVFMDGNLTKTYRVPTSGAGAYWHVFDLTGTVFTDVNTLSAGAPSTP